MTEKERKALQFALEVIWVNEHMFSDLAVQFSALAGALKKYDPGLFAEYEDSLDALRSRAHDQVRARVERIEREQASLK